jgi:hypothetical protein
LFLVQLLRGMLAQQESTLRPDELRQRMRRLSIRSFKPGRLDRNGQPMLFNLMLEIGLG